MQAVKNVSRNGRSVMVTIHQPSIEIFETFDALVLLQAGGRVRPPAYPWAASVSLECIHGVARTGAGAAALPGVPASFRIGFKLPEYGVNLSQPGHGSERRAADGPEPCALVYVHFILIICRV